MKPHAIVPLEESLRLQSSVDEDSQEQQQQYDTNIFFSSSPLQPEGQPEPESEEPSDPSSEEAKKAAKRASRQRSKLRKKKLKFADSYAHPYAPEINAYTYPAAVHTSSPPIPPTDFDKNPATFVDTTEGLHAMVQELKGAAAIAVDLEHHDYRTYVGITSLMQISTREKDFVIDTLKPWRRQLEVLNEIFANPAILKVFHGSTMDMIWLQRDLGLYIVGLFDTFHACRALGYPRAGLDYLLQKFVNFEAQKQYQKADWRIRPLPSELFDYARSDTHFLLYVYDNMRNELISRSTPDNDLLQYVLENSKVESLQRYEHFFYDSESGNGQLGWRKALLNTSAMFDKQQFAVFRALHAWRDEVARQEDDSTGFIIPQHGLFAVARAMPTETGNLFATLPGMSLPVRMRSNELVAVIAKAKEDGKDGPELNEVLGVLGKRKREGEESGPLTAKNQEMPRTKEAPKIVEAPPLENVRATTSNFWGPAFSAGGARNSIKFTAKAATNRLRLALPLPNLTAQVYADPAEVAAATSKTNEHMNPGARAEHAYVTSKGRAKTPVDDDVFVVQQLGGKRKRPHYEDQSLLQPMEGNFDPAADQLAVDEDELDWMQEKQLRQREHAQREEYNKQKKAEQEQLRAEKKEKRAEKRRKKSGQNGLPSDGTVPSLDGSGGLPYDEETPFDYSTAPSVLHARDAVDVTGGRKGKKGGGFDPYKKALDAPKGLGKRQKDNRGRSGTFAN